MPPVEANLDLVLDDALRSLDELSQTFDDIVSNLQSNLDNAMSGLLDNATAFAAAMDEAGTTLGDRLADLDLTAMQEDLKTGIEQAFSEANPTVDATINVDAGDATDELSGAQTEADQLAQSLQETSQAGAGAAASLNNAGNAGSLLSGAFAIAHGEGNKLIGGLNQFGGPLGKLIGGLGAAAVGYAAFFQAGERSVAAQERLNIVFGDAAVKVTQLHVGGLNGDLGELAIKAGSSGAALKQSAASLGELGINSGKTAGQVAATVQQVQALALRASVLNPTLGEAGAVAQRLNLALARGGRALARYNIDLQAREITERALHDSGKTAVADLTIFERAAAGAALATEKLGTSIGTDFARGAEQSTIKLRSLKAAASAAFADAGKQLVEPTINALTELEPAIEGVIHALGSVASVGVPVFGAAFKALGTLLKPLVAILDEMPPGLLAAGAAMLIFRSRVETLGSSMLTPVGRAMALNSTVNLLGKQMESVGGRATLAVAGVALLDTALAAAGTSADELGLKTTEMGAAIGFTFGGPWGAAIGAAIGLVVDLTGGVSALDATFADMKPQTAALEQALYNDATSAETLSTALGVLDGNLKKFIETQSRFKTHDQLDDLKRIGETTLAVGQRAEEGASGLARFYDAAVRGGEISKNISLSAKAASAGISGGLVGAVNQLDAGTQKALVSVFKLHEQADGLSGTYKNVTKTIQISGHEFAALSIAQQNAVISALTLEGGNASLVNSFRSLQKGIQEAGKAEFQTFSDTNNLSTAIQRASREAARVDGVVNYTQAVKNLQEAALGIGPAFAGLPGRFAVVQRVLGQLSAAVDGAAKNLPTLGDAFGQAIEKAQQFHDAFGTDVTTGVTNILNQTAATTTSFFNNIQAIIQAGQPALATALLQLGPSNLGAQAKAQLAANRPDLTAGWETALQGLAQAQIVATTILNEQSANIGFQAAALGSNMVNNFARSISGGKGLGQLTEDELVKVAYHFSTAGGPIGTAAQAVVEKAKEKFVALHLNEPGDKAAAEFMTALKSTGQVKAPDAAKGITDKTKTELDKVRPKAKQAGDDAATGFAEGLGSSAALKRTTLAATSQAVAAITAFQSVLQTSSPSLVMKEIGQFTSLGFAIGMEDVIPRTQTAATAVANSAVSGITTASSTAAALAQHLQQTLADLQTRYVLQILAGQTQQAFVTGIQAFQAQQAVNTNAQNNPPAAAPADAPVVGVQNFYGMDAQAAASATGRELAWQRALAGV